MKFLIAGFGSIGRRHFRNLRALGEGDILFYRSGSSQLPDEEIEGFDVERTIEAALGHNPDAVIVCNPTALHLSVAIPAAKAGCHLLLEKPISHSLEGVGELRRAVEKRGSRVLVGFQYRFHPGLKKAKALLDSGELGRPLAARVHWGEYLPDWHPWEDYRQGYSARPDLGGGVVLTLSHPFDYLRWLLGEVEALSGYAQHSGELGINVEDLASINLRFANGALAAVQLDYLQKPSAHWLEILCTQGSLQWDAQSHYLKVYWNEGEAWEEHAPADGFERNELFMAQMRHFSEVVGGQAEPLCSLEDGVRALEIALAVQQSSSEGKEIRLGA